jgi:hypothetical protein
MVGVTSPVFRNRRFNEGRRLVAGYVLGTGLASMLIALAIIVLSVGVEEILPMRGRYYSLGGALVVLLVLDASGRVIFLNRQTPQRIRLLPPFARGMIWGLDIGLLVTTIKVTSLVWALIIITVTEPSNLILEIATYYTVHLVSEGFALLIDYRSKGRLFERLQERRIVLDRAARATSVALLAAAAALTLVQASS